MSALYASPKRRGVGLTSLIDVVFILLLFFMLTSSFTRQQQLTLASPVASSTAAPETPQRVALSANAELSQWGQSKALTDGALIAGFDRNIPLVISASETTSVQIIVSTLLRLDTLGFSQVSIGPLWVKEGTQ